MQNTKRRARGLTARPDAKRDILMARRYKFQEILFDV
jgi:hypothetical protein